MRIADASERIARAQDNEFLRRLPRNRSKNTTFFDRGPRSDMSFEKEICVEEIGVVEMAPADELDRVMTSLAHASDGWDPHGK